MLTIQQDLFSTARSPGKYLANGCFGTVWAHPDGETVIKRCDSDDGTLAWLYWSHNSGLKLPGMPEIYSLVLMAQEGYVVTMKRYESCRCGSEHHDAFHAVAQEPGGGYENMWYHPNKRTDIYVEAQRLFTEAIKAAPEVSSSLMFDGFDDMHQGNIMFDPDKDELVITDPSSSPVNREHLWKLLPRPANFNLEIQ